MDALSLLTADHNRVRGLFTRFETAHEAEDTVTTVEAGTKILEELEVHAAIEEEVFYPGVDGLGDEIHEVVTEGIEEHHVVKQLAQEIMALEPGDETWLAKMKVMIENVEHHAEEEEEELFPQVRKALDPAGLAELGERLERAKARLGAPTVADKESLSLEELRELASQQQIPGRSSMSREELQATVAPA